jgi:hypothetical protein
MKKIARMATHVPLLTRAFDLSQGDVLEVGTGYFSTTLLDWLCAISDRKLVSYETDPKWYEKAKRMQSDYHDIIFVENWKNIPLEEKHWGLALVDHDPHKERAITIERLKDNADYIVAHDTEPRSEKGYNYPRIYPLFKYRFDDKKVEPWTSVFSNTVNVAKYFAGVN